MYDKRYFVCATDSGAPRTSESVSSDGLRKKRSFMLILMSHAHCNKILPKMTVLTILRVGDRGSHEKQRSGPSTDFEIRPRLSDNESNVE